VITFSIISTPPPLIAELHAGEDLQITSISQNETSLPFTHDPPFLTIPSSDFSIPIAIDFSGPLNRQSGFYMMANYSCATRFEAEWARDAFPCFDEPRVRSRLTLTLTIPSFLTPISNHPISTSTISDDVTTFTFIETPPLPTYLFAWAFDEFAVQTGTTSRGLPIDVYYRNVSSFELIASQILSDEIRIVEYLEDFYDFPLPFPRLQVALLFSFAPAGMENYGYIALSEPAMLHRTIPWRRDLLIHETIHQWAGDIVTINSWTQLGLNEGFARFLPKYFAEDIFDDDSLLQVWLTDTAESLLTFDSLPSDRHAIVPDSYDNPRDLFDMISYDKAGFVLAMIRKYVGPENFRSALRNFYRKYAFKSVGFDELLPEFEGCEAFGGWLRQCGCPMLIVEEDGLIYQAPISGSAENDGLKWRIPVDVVYESGGKVVSEARVIGEEPVPVGDGVDWICLNASGVGLFHVWSKGVSGSGLAQAIRLLKLQKIAVERVQHDVVEVVGLCLATESLLDQFDARGRRVWTCVQVDPNSGSALARF
jgi:puromycin-sensitive aminopeptidase